MGTVTVPEATQVKLPPGTLVRVHEAALQFLEDRAEFERWSEAGTSLEESVATRLEARGHGYGRR